MPLMPPASGPMRSSASLRDWSRAMLTHRQQHILQHLGVGVFEHLRVDDDALAALVAGHGHLNRPAAHGRRDGFFGQLRLGLFHLLLQLLNLRHHPTAAARPLPPIPLGRLKPFAMTDTSSDKKAVQSNSQFVNQEMRSRIDYSSYTIFPPRSRAVPTMPSPSTSRSAGGRICCPPRCSAPPAPRPKPSGGPGGADRYSPPFPSLILPPRSENQARGYRL